MEAAERWARVESLMRKCLALDPVQREDWLLNACGTEPGLYQEVSALLRADADPDQPLDRFLDTGLALFEAGEASEEKVRYPRIDGYDIQRRLGVGGTSTVFLALSPEGQEVAVKVLRPGCSLPEVQRRFHAESTALTKLRHPGFAHFLAAGETPEGLCFVVTEYICGLPLDAYCEDLGLAATLKLFIEICHAVDHAHRHLVIHRDLKPANIVVTPEGRPKILDLGLARILDSELETSVEPTATEGRMLTPAFASPEQLGGGRLSTATDIYSLGVLLYVGLTGRHPHEESRGAPGALARAIVEDAPMPPSRRPRSRAALSRDLDAIVLKALRKEPDLRFSSASSLADDLERFLDGRPVASRRGSRLYRAGKFLRRHRWAAAGTAALVCLLATFSVLSFLQERRSRRAQEQTQRTLGVLVDLLGATDPKTAEVTATTVDELLQRAARDFLESFGDEPVLRASVLEALGRAYVGRGQLQEAEPLLESSLELRRGAALQGGVDLLRSLIQLGQLRELQGNFEAAEKYFREAIELGRRSRFTAEVAQALNGLGDTLHGQGLYGPAQEAYRQALSLRRRLHGPEDPRVAETLNHLAVLAHEQGDYDRAEELYRQSLSVRTAALGPRHPDVAQSLGNLGMLLSVVGRFEEAAKLLERALDLRRAVLGDDHLEVALNLDHLGVLSTNQGRYHRAEELLVEAERIYRRGDDSLDSDLAANLLRQGHLKVLQGSLKEAEAFFRESYAAYLRSLEADHPWTTFPQVALGQVLVAQGQAHEAEPLLREALRIRNHALAPDNWLLAEAEASLGACLVELGRLEEARFRLVPSTARLREILGIDHETTRYAQRFLKAAETPPAAAGGQAEGLD